MMLPAGISASLVQPVTGFFETETADNIKGSEANTWPPKKGVAADMFSYSAGKLKTIGEMYEKWVHPIFEVEGKGGGQDPLTPPPSANEQQVTDLEKRVPAWYFTFINLGGIYLLTASKQLGIAIPSFHARF